MFILQPTWLRLFVMLALFITGLSFDMYGQEIKKRDSLKEMEERQLFNEIYGNSLYIMIDDNYTELMPKSIHNRYNNNIPLSRDALPEELERCSSIVVASLPVVHNMLLNKEAKLPEETLNKWDIFQHTSGTLVFVPSRLHVDGATKDLDLGVDLRSCRKIESIHKLKIERWLLVMQSVLYRAIPENMIKSTLHVAQGILIPRQPEANNPNWQIVVEGHGIYPYAKNKEGLICGVKASVFKNFLDYLQDHLSVKCFMYRSCHAGNKYNRDILFADKKYCFPVFSTSFEDGAAVSSTNLPTISRYHPFCMMNKISYPLSKSNSNQIEDALNNLFRFEIFAENRVQVRWPEAKNFEPLYGTIVQPMSAAQDPIPQLDWLENMKMTKRLNDGKRLFVLNEQYYRTITIPHENDKIVPGESNEACVIDTMIVPGNKPLLSAIVKNNFCLLKDGDVHKKIIIKQLKTEDNKQQLKNVIVEQKSLYQDFYKNEKSLIYFEEDNESKYCDLNGDENPSVCDKRMANYYKGILQQNNNSLFKLLPSILISGAIGYASRCVYDQLCGKK